MDKSRKIVNIVLVGFMGTGKSSVGMKLSEMLGMGFIDTDDIVEADSGMIISDIFAEKGEEYFRDLESEAVEKTCKLSHYVIATGGGVVIRDRNIRNLRSTGMLFCLDAPPEVIFERTSGHSHRPLLQVGDAIGRIHEMLEIREPLYAKADHRIDTSKFTIDQIAEKVADLFKSYSLIDAVE